MTDEAPDVEVESVRFLQRAGAKTGKLSVVVGGVHHVWNCSRERMFVLIESGLESLRRQEQP